MDDLLIWVLVIVFVLYLFGRRRRSAQQKSNQPEPMSYERVDGDTLSFSTTSELASRSWEPHCLEDVPYARRRRLILSITVSPDPDEQRGLEGLLWSLAAQLQARARAHVVVVEAFARSAPTTAGSGILRLLFAPDGRGWSGEEAVVAVVAGEEESRSLSLGEVHRKVLTGLGEPF